MPPKKQKTKDIRTFFKRSGDPGSSRSSSAESGQTGGAKGSETGGATNCQPGGAKGSETGGATNCQPGGAKGSETGGATNCQPGGAKGSETGGATNCQPGGAKGSEKGGATNCQPGGATGSEKGGATNCQPGGATNCQPGGATNCQPRGATGSEKGGADSQTATYNEVTVKKENNGESEAGHSHCFNVQFSHADPHKYPIVCNKPRTVLQAIKSLKIYNTKVKCSDEKIMIQLGKGETCIVATHFPCSCISDGECLIMSYDKSENVEETRSYQTIHPRDNYSVFHIDTAGGLNARTKKLFRNNAVKKFPFLCVYGEKGMTVEEALKGDGRFVDELDDFTLSDYDDSKCIFEQGHKVDHLDNKKIRICLPKNKRANDDKQQEKAGTSDSAQQSCDPVLDVVKQTGISVRKAVEKSGSDADTEEIYEMLRQQFPELKKLMESRFSGVSYQETLNLMKEEFGKSQQSFSEVHRLKKMFKLGESVCKVVVKDVCVGTGFVLFDNFILTNGHLFKDCVVEGRLQQGIEVSVLFNYEEPEPHLSYYYFTLDKSFICYGEDGLDYAVLQLNPEGLKPNQTTQPKKMKIPPGLLKNFGPLPPNGEACIIGHPAGGVKQIDPTFIIEKDRRERAVNDYLSKYKDNDFIVHVINTIKNQGIENIMMGGNKADKVSTYNTFMYHGSSGSPVFDALGRVFGLHTAGHTYEFQNNKGSVIEYAQPLLTIFEHFVCKMKESRRLDLLKRVKKESKSNDFLKKVLKTADTDELSDSSESMDID